MKIPLKRKIFLAAALVALAVIGFNSFQKHVLKERVEARRRELIAQGEKLTLAELAPKWSDADRATSGGTELLNAYRLLSDTEIHTHASFASGSPRQVFWRGDLALSGLPTNNPTQSSWAWLEDHLSKDQDLLNQVIQVTDRRDCNFNFVFETGLNVNVTNRQAITMPALLLQEAVLCQLHRGNSNEALRLLRAQIRLLRLGADGETFLLHEARLHVCRTACQSTWQALQYPDWNDFQLADMQTNWEALVFLPALEHALAEHRAWFLEIIAALRQDFAPWGTNVFSPRNPLASNNRVSILMNPSAWMAWCQGRYPQYRDWKDCHRQYCDWKGRQSFHDELFVMDAIQVALDNVRSLQSGRQDIATAMHNLRSTLQNTNAMRNSYTNGFTEFTRRSVIFMLEAQEMNPRRQLTIAAIAIKRHQLAHGRLPDSLTNLVPAFVAKPILDPMDGQPLRYRPNPDGTFLLYSVGFDGKDNGGAGTNDYSFEEGTDQIWPIPARP